MCSVTEAKSKWSEASQWIGVIQAIVDRAVTGKAQPNDCDYLNIAYWEIRNLVRPSSDPLNPETGRRVNTEQQGEKGNVTQS